MKKHTRSGFTIVELIIVIAVIGVLAAIIIPLMSNIIKKAHIKSARSDANAVIKQYISTLDDGAVGETLIIIVEKADEYYVYEYRPRGGELLESAYNPYKPEKYGVNQKTSDFTVRTNKFTECLVDITHIYVELDGASTDAPTDMTPLIPDAPKNVRVWNGYNLLTYAGRVNEHDIFSVEFIDGVTNERLSGERIIAGGSVTPPAAPVHEGFSFSGWRGTYENVLLNSKVYATYTRTAWAGGSAEALSDGSGTKTDPYIITGAADLMLIANDVNSGATSYDDCYFKLTNDVYVNDTYSFEDEFYTITVLGQEVSAELINRWTPIGTDANPFMGHFDGNDHIIYGLYADTKHDASITALGLFGVIENATITDTHIVSAYFSGNTDSCNVGAVVGKVIATEGSTSIISGCSDTLRVTSKSPEIFPIINGKNCGGIIGAVQGYSQADGVQINSCYNSRMIGNQAAESAGIVGCSEGGLTISDCFNSGTAKAGILNKFIGTANIASCYDTAASSIAIAPAGASCTNCYCTVDYGTQKQGATALTKAQMCDKASFSGFDFTGVNSTWVYDGTRYPYPELRDNRYLFMRNEWSGMAAAKFDSGSGTKLSPYKIGNCEQLMLLSELLVSTPEYRGKYYELSSDIYVCSDQYPTLSKTSGTAFSGTFNGNGHTIHELYLSATDKGDYNGLFGYISGAIVTNVTLDTCFNASANPDTVQTASYVGGIAGYATNSTIEKCTSLGSGIAGATCVGGIVGLAENGCTILGCTVISRAFESVFIRGTSSIGGIVGHANGATVSLCIARTINCVGEMHVAGIVGYSEETTTTNCKLIYGAVTGASNIGGVVGLGEGARIETSYSSGEITANLQNVGCIAGYLKKSANGTASYIKTTYAEGTSYGLLNVGGMAGMTESATISDCFLLGCVYPLYKSEHVSECTNFGNITGYSSGGKILRCFSVSSYSLGYILTKVNSSAVCGMTYGTCDASNVPQVTNVYMVKDNAGIAANGATLITDAQLGKEATYAGFNFDEVWIWGARGLSLPTLQNNIFTYYE